MIRQLKSESLVFLLALQFLTRLPIAISGAYTPERFAASVRYYPLVGVLIGAVISSLYFISSMFYPAIVAVLLSTAGGLLLTGAFHEDGLADMFDGIGGGQTPEHSLEIMKDSRIGVFGALALLAVLAIKIAALTELPIMLAATVLVTAHGLSRWSSLLVIASSGYVREEGTAKPVAKGVSVPSMIVATLLAASCLVAIFIVSGPGIAVAALLGLAAGHGLSRLFYERKLGGYTGDCLGATQQISELGIYLSVVACL